MAARCARPGSRAALRRRASAALGACALGLCLAAQAAPTPPAPPMPGTPTPGTPAASKPAPNKPAPNKPVPSKPAQAAPVQIAHAQTPPAQAAPTQAAPGKPAQDKSAAAATPATAAPAAAPTGSAAPNRPPAVRDDGRTAARDWIGRVVPPYPDGYRSNTGGCVGSGRNAEQICARSIGTIDDSEDRSQLLYAAELVGRAGNEARWKITDVVPYPRLQRGERVSISSCLFDGAGDPGVIAVVDTLVENAAARETFDAVRWAVRLDRGNGRFVEIKAAQVQCYNEGAEGE